MIIVHSLLSLLWQQKPQLEVNPIAILSQCKHLAM